MTKIQERRDDGWEAATPISDRARIELDGLVRLAAARDIASVVLEGRWPATPAVVGALAGLVESARQRFAWAEGAAA